MGEETGPRFLWKQDSRRDPGEGQGASVTEHVPALGSVAGGGSWLLCGEMEKGASLDGLLSAVL